MLFVFPAAPATQLPVPSAAHPTSDASWTHWAGEDLAAADLATLVASGAPHSLDLELAVQYQDWGDDGRLAAGLR